MISRYRYHLILLSCMIFLGAIFYTMLKNRKKTVNIVSTENHKILRLLEKKHCAGCHGVRGQGHLSITAPPLAGQSKEQLINKIKEYRDGKKTNPAMRLVTHDLSDEEIIHLATYYSNFKQNSK